MESVNKYCIMKQSMRAKEILKQAELKKEDFTNESIYNTVVGNICKLLTEIDELQDNKIEWVSVNKRVDIKGGKYLVYDPNWIEDNKIRTAFYRNYNGIWIADNGSDDVIHPSHYMKLPNTPENNG